MTSFVFIVVLAAAVLHATWNALVKSGGDPFLRLAIVNVTGSAITLPFAFFYAPPPAEAWPWIAASIVTHTAYYTLLGWSYRHGDLSHVYPIARGVAPPTVALGAFLLAGEQPSLIGLLAILLICAGIVALARTGGFSGEAQRRSLFLALGTGLMIALYTISDGIGVRASQGAANYVVWLFLLDGFLYGGVVLWLRRHSLRASLRHSLLPAVAGGALSMVAYALVIWAMRDSPMAYVSALRETSVILAAIIGATLLKEPFGRQRIAAAMLVAAGVAVLEFAPPG